MFIKKNILLLMILSLLTVLVNGAGLKKSFKGYGDAMGLDLYARFLDMSDDFYTCVEVKNHAAMQKYANEFIQKGPNLALGYFFQLTSGLLKNDLDLVQKSLDQMTDKYMVMPEIYSRFIPLVKKRAFEKNNDKTFTSGVDAALDHFFRQRELFLKESLNYKINRKAIWKELVYINDQIGDEDDFLIYIEKLMPTDLNFIYNFSEKRKDPKDKRFQNLKQSFFKKSLTWNGTVEEKIRGLLLVASEVRFWNASLDFSPIDDWNSHVASYIPKVLAAKSKLEYYDVLTEIIAKVGEDHTTLWLPSDIHPMFSRPGILTTYASEKFLVKKITQDSLKKKIHIGDEIIGIDDLPVNDYLEKNKSRFPFVRWSFFPQKIHVNYKISFRLLSGKKDSTVSVEFKRPNGETYRLDLVRDAYKVTNKVTKKNKSKKIKAKNSKPKKNALVELEILKDNIYFFKIKSFWGSDIYQDFLDLIKNKDTSRVKGVIFDIRDNGGGNSGFGDSIFSHFIDKPMNNYIFGYYPIRNIRKISTDSLGYISWVTGGFPIEPSDSQRFTCPVAVLTSPFTGSASEDFAFLFKYHKRGSIIGQPTSGGTGQGHQVLLPGGARIRICLNVDLFFSWLGIQPDFFVDYTPRDLRDNNDPYLIKAIEILKKKHSK